MDHCCVEMKRSSVVTRLQVEHQATPALPTAPPLEVASSLRLAFHPAVRHNILEFSARVLATFPCEILRFSEIPVEFFL